MTTLHITVGDREQLRQDTLQFVQDVDAADLDSLTPLRLELIQAIAKEEPKSMREAASLVDRDDADSAPASA